MRRLLLSAVLALLPGLMLPAVGKSPEALEKARPAEEGAACGDFGTSVDFVDTPSEAARLAKKAGKLVCVLHISGNFEDPRFTWNNAEALRVNALASPEVGKYLNEYFVSSFQKVGTFRIVGNQKQGGNVATYFCAPDGRVLHVVAGPVDSGTLLREAKWVVTTTQEAIKESKGDGGKFKVHFRKAHAQRLRSEHGLAAEPLLFDPPQNGEEGGALTYNDPTGRPLAPVLQPAQVEGVDVTFRAKQAEAAAAPGARALLDGRGGRWALGNQGRVHQLMAAHAMVKIEKVYASIFEGILGERISTQPVQVETPFPWVAARDGGR